MRVLHYRYCYLQRGQVKTILLQYYLCSSRASKAIAIVAVSLGLDFSEIFQVRKDLEWPIFLIVSVHKLDLKCIDFLYPDRRD